MKPNRGSVNKFKHLLPLPLPAAAGAGWPCHPSPCGCSPAVLPDHQRARRRVRGPGQELTVPWFVEDSGADPLAITMSLTELVPMAWKSPAIGWTSIAQSQITLGSGQYQDVQVTADVPPGTPDGNYAVNVMASAQVPGCSGTCVGEAVAGTLEVHVAD